MALVIKFLLFMIVPTCRGGLVCLFSLCVLNKNIEEDTKDFQKVVKRWWKKTLGRHKCLRGTTG